MADRLARRVTTRREGASAISLRGFGVSGRTGLLDLDIAAGELVGLSGLVGSGRTRLARGLVGMERAVLGTVTVGPWSGRPRDPAEAASVGILLLAEDRKRQGLVLPRSVAENIALTALRTTLTSYGLVRSQRRGVVVRELMDRLSVVPARSDVPVARLSGGNQQKVVFARAMAASARVLVLDQPTAGVDVGAKEELYAQIDRLAGEGVAMILISDDLDELLRLCDRIVVMRRGHPQPPVPVAHLDRAGLLEAISDTSAAAA
jgi:ABC-type sugar transport system ATPase subunit